MNPAALLGAYAAAVSAADALLARLPGGELGSEELQGALVSLLHSAAKLGLRLAEQMREESDGSGAAYMRLRVEVWLAVDRLVSGFIQRVLQQGGEGRVAVPPSMLK